MAVPTRYNTTDTVYSRLDSFSVCSISRRQKSSSAAHFVCFDFSASGLALFLGGCPDWWGIKLADIICTSQSGNSVAAFGLMPGCLTTDWLYPPQD